MLLIIHIKWIIALAYTLILVAFNVFNGDTSEAEVWARAFFSLLLYAVFWIVWLLIFY